MAAMQDALNSQLDISNSHLLNTLFDALYSASFRSKRCVMSKDGFSFVVEEVEEKDFLWDRFPSLLTMFGEVSYRGGSL